MVNKHPYKVLANYSYDWDGQALANASESLHQMTDVRDNLGCILISISILLFFII